MIYKPCTRNKNAEALPHIKINNISDYILFQFKAKLKPLTANKDETDYNENRTKYEKHNERDLAALSKELKIFLEQHQTTSLIENNKVEFLNYQLPIKQKKNILFFPQLSMYMISFKKYSKISSKKLQTLNYFK